MQVHGLLDESIVEADLYCVLEYALALWTGITKREPVAARWLDQGPSFLAETSHLEDAYRVASILRLWRYPGQTKCLGRLSVTGLQAHIARPWCTAWVCDDGHAAAAMLW